MAITRLGGANAISGTLPAANINDTSIGNITALPAGVGGKVLQVVQGLNATNTGTTSTTYSDNISVNITPSSTSSKIFILATTPIRKVNSDASDTSAGLRILKDGSNLVEYGFYMAWHNNASQYNQESASFNYLDSPSTTSQITYKSQFKTMNSPGDISVNHDGSYSTLTLMEIAG